MDGSTSLQQPLEKAELMHCQWLVPPIPPMMGASPAVITLLLVWGRPPTIRVASAARGLVCCRPERGRLLPEQEVHRLPGVRAPGRGVPGGLVQCGQRAVDGHGGHQTNRLRIKGGGGYEALASQALGVVPDGPGQRLFPRQLLGVPNRQSSSRGSIRGGRSRAGLVGHLGGRSLLNQVWSCLLLLEGLQRGMLLLLVLHHLLLLRLVNRLEWGLSHWLLGLLRELDRLLLRLLRLLILERLLLRLHRLLVLERLLLLRLHRLLVLERLLLLRLHRLLVLQRLLLLRLHRLLVLERLLLLRLHRLLVLQRLLLLCLYRLLVLQRLLLLRLHRLLVLQGLLLDWLLVLQRLLLRLHRLLVLLGCIVIKTGPLCLRGLTRGLRAASQCRCREGRVVGILCAVGSGRRTGHRHVGGRRSSG